MDTLGILLLWDFCPASRDALARVYFRMIASTAQVGVFLHFCTRCLELFAFSFPTLVMEVSLIISASRFSTVRPNDV